MGSKKCTESRSWKENQKRIIEKTKADKILRIQQYNSFPILCKTCREPLKYEKRRNLYCSSSCAAKTTNLKNRKWGNPPINKCCLWCGAIFSVSKNRGAKYCSRNCSHASCKNETFKNIENGYQGGTRATYKKYLIEKKGYFCSICGICEWMNKKISLELDHEDGDATNNSLDNLRLLCPNCHAQTPTWKNRNKGFGRGARNMSLG